MNINVNSIEPSVIAIVSGKGGSGKTMLAATLAKILDSEGKKILLIDADFGTGGLTYYMGLNEVSNISVGLTNLMTATAWPRDGIWKLTQKMRSFRNAMFMGVGDHRRYLKQHHNINDDELYEPLLHFFETARSEFDVIIVDCRGGIDEESLGICSLVDAILIVAETDTTSFQSTQHLVDVLYDNNLSNKLRGFFINKVFDDPSSIARNGTSAFRTQYLSSVPFDLDATRSFLIGDIPSLFTYFSRQVWHGAHKSLPNLLSEPMFHSLSFADFRALGIRDKDSLIGGVLLSFVAMGLGVVLLYNLVYRGDLLRYSDQTAFMFLLIVVSGLTGIEPVRKAVGRAFNIYNKLVLRVFLGRK